MSRTVLISGAGIAGPALAYWLAKYGFQPTVVELAGDIRPAGHAVDFRGDTHRQILQTMGMWDQLRAMDTGGSPIEFVAADNSPLARLPGHFAGGDVEVQRGALCQLLYARSAPDCEYLFNDSIAAMTPAADHVAVRFRSGLERDFHYVIGADGVHSTVRRLAFGPHRQYVRHLDYFVAGWTQPNDVGATSTMRIHNVPGKAIGVAADSEATAHAMAYFSSPPLHYDRADIAQQKSLVIQRFSDVGWRAPCLLEGLRDTTDMYFSPIHRVDVPDWASDRVVLLGDAAYGATIGGMGAGTSIVGAYVLAGEMATTPDDPHTAFARYQRLLRRYVRKCQRGGDGVGRFMAPRSQFGLKTRNRLFNSSTIMNWQLKIADSQAADIPLPTYDTPAAPTP